MKKVNLKEALKILRMDQSYFAKQINKSKETVSACVQQRLGVSQETKERMLIVLNAFRDAEVNRLEEEIRLLKNLYWEI